MRSLFSSSSEQASGVKLEETPPEKLPSFLVQSCQEAALCPFNTCLGLVWRTGNLSSPNISHVLLPPFLSLFTVPNTLDEPLNQRPKSPFIAIWSKVGVQHPPPSTLPPVDTFT